MCEGDLTIHLHNSLSNDDSTIAAKRDIAPSVSGNTGGRYGKEKWSFISEDPVKERWKKK